VSAWWILALLVLAGCAITPVTTAAQLPALLQLPGLSAPPDPCALPKTGELVLAAPVLRDTDRDGKADAAIVTTVSGLRVRLDPGQRVLPSTSPAAIAPTV
jgi:hypothetical protein